MELTGPGSCSWKLPPPTLSPVTTVVLPALTDEPPDNVWNPSPHLWGWVTLPMTMEDG